MNDVTVAAVLCALLWSGAFEIEVPGPQFHQAERQVRVELCTQSNEPRVVVRTRIYLKRTDGPSPDTAWTESANERLYVTTKPGAKESNTP